MYRSRFGASPVFLSCLSFSTIVKMIRLTLKPFRVINVVHLGLHCGPLNNLCLLCY